MGNIAGISIHCRHPQSLIPPAEELHELNNLLHYITDQQIRLQVRVNNSRYAVKQSVQTPAESSTLRAAKGVVQQTVKVRLDQGISISLKHGEEYSEIKWTNLKAIGPFLRHGVQSPDPSLCKARSGFCNSDEDLTISEVRHTLFQLTRRSSY